VDKNGCLSTYSQQTVKVFRPGTLANKDSWPEILALCQNRVTITRNGLIEDAPYKDTMGDPVLFGTDYFMTEQEDGEKILFKISQLVIESESKRHS
jgi:hypothetical protein